MKKTTPPLNLITKAIKNGSIAELVSMFGNEDAIKGYMSPLGGVLH